MAEQVKSVRPTEVEMLSSKHRAIQQPLGHEMWERKEKGTARRGTQCPPLGV